MKQSPLSQTQLGIYLGSAYRDDLAYHIAYIFRFPADTDPDSLAVALRKTIAAHPALNVSIDTDDKGEAFMKWDENYIPEIPVDNMTEAQFEALKPMLIEHLAVPGNHMSRFRIIRTENSTCLIAIIHHIIYDGSSMRIFLHDLDSALKGNNPGKETFTQFDVVEKEIAGRKTPQYDEQKEYYKRTFGDFDSDGTALFPDAREIKAEDKTGRESATAGNHKIFRLLTSPDVFKGGAATANAAMGIALGAFTGRDDVLFTTVYHGRNTPDTENTVGMLVRTLPVRCRLGDDTTVAGLIAEMKAQRDATRANDLYSFADFSAMLGYEQNVLFGYQGRLLDIDGLIDGMTAERIDNGDTGVPPHHTDVCHRQRPRRRRDMARRPLFRSCGKSSCRHF